MKPRLLQLTTCLEPGGAEQMILTLARDLTPRCELTVAFLKGRGSLAPAFVALGARVVPIRLEHATDVPALLRLGRLFLQGRFDLVHTHLLHAGILGRTMARAAKVPALVHTQHNTLTWETQSRWLALSNRLSLRMADRVVAVGETVARMLREHGAIPPSRIELVYNGVDCKRFRPARNRAYAENALGIPADGPLVAVIAGFRPEKGHDVLFDAMPAVFGAVRGARLLLVGEGPLREKIQRRIDRSGFANRITLAGCRDDIDRLLPGCDVVVIPSWQEGIPVSALEAMACAVPVVATHAGGTTEVVQDGRTGLVVSPGDSAGMARAVIELLRRPDYARALGKEGRERVTARFDASRMTGKTIALYEALLEAKGGPPLVWN